MPRFSTRGLLNMLVVGAVAGSFCDGFHTHSGTTSYPHPVFWMMASWTPPLFAVAYLLVGVGYTLVHPRRPLPEPRRAGVAFVVFGALYFASGYLPASNPIKLDVMLIGGLAVWAAIDRTPASLLLGVGAAIVGPAWEIMLVHFGAFLHLQPDFAGIPMWLPGLYFASIPSAGPFIAWLGTPTRQP